MLTTASSFKGGYRFARFEGQAADQIDDLAAPQSVTLPLDQKGQALTPAVAVGDSVQAGTAVADHEASPAPLVASISGTVADIGTAITIDSDGKSGWEPVAGHQSDWSSLSADALRTVIYRSGATALGSTIPTGRESDPAAPDAVQDVVVKLVAVQPYNLNPAVLLDGERLSSFVEGLRILKVIMPNASIRVVTDSRRSQLLRELAAKLDVVTDAHLHSIDAKYPAMSDRLLAAVLLGHDLLGREPAAPPPAVWLDAQAVLQVFDAVTQGKPLVDTVVALAGPGFERPMHVRTRIGTPVRHLVDGRLAADRPLRLVVGNVLTGSQCDLDQPVGSNDTLIVALDDSKTRQPVAFLMPGLRRDSYSLTFVSKLVGLSRVADTGLHGEKRPCVACGFCEDVCPARLVPHFLAKHVERGFADERLPRYEIFKCVDCNLCSYVCPCKIHVGGLIADGKQALIDEGLVQPEPGNHARAAS